MDYQICEYCWATVFEEQLSAHFEQVQYHQPFFVIQRLILYKGVHKTMYVQFVRMHGKVLLMKFVCIIIHLTR